MAAKEIKVGVVLPATTQLKITNVNESVAGMGGVFTIKSDNDTFTLVDYNIDFNMNNKFSINGVSVTYSWDSNPYIIIDTSDWDINKRTISTDTTYDGAEFMWEDLNPESEPSGHTKIEVGTILPATTQLKVILDDNGNGNTWPFLTSAPVMGTVFKTTDSYLRVESGWDGELFEGVAFVYREIDGVRIDMRLGWTNYSTCGIDNNLNCNTSNIFTVDTSTWTLEQRTVTQVYQGLSSHGLEMQYEDIGETVIEIENYTISFETNGGTPVSAIEEVTELPTPLPTPTKLNNIFAGWYYNSALNQRAYAGDAMEDDVTLYAKWYTNIGDFYLEVADSIRDKKGTTSSIKPVDFAEEISTLPAVVELTQAQYDALSENALVWENPSALAETELCPIDGINYIGTSCSVEGTKRTVAGVDIGMSSGCYEITCVPRPRPAYDDNTYYLIVEE